MAYLIDSNCFIQAKNMYYGFDFCPGYWQWLDVKNQQGVVFSLDKIKQELTIIQDDLADWAVQRGEGFFLPSDAGTMSAMGQIATWVHNGTFKPQAKPDFLSCADPFLIAHALAHGHTVVSHERLIVGETKKVKIPVVCQQFSVPCITLFDLLRSESARFGLM